MRSPATLAVAGRSTDCLLRRYEFIISKLVGKDGQTDVGDCAAVPAQYETHTRSTAVRWEETSQPGRFSSNPAFKTSDAHIWSELLILTTREVEKSLPLEARRKANRILQTTVSTFVLELAVKGIAYEIEKPFSIAS